MDQGNENQTYGSYTMNGIQVMTIIGEIEGHQEATKGVKSTKYEHIIPVLTQFEQDTEKQGLLVILNTIGGDVECGLALSELIASLSKPTVSLVLGGSHSIGVPLAVSTDTSFIVSSATMMLHPVRTGGTFIGVPQSYHNLEKIQDRITAFIHDHTKMRKKEIEDYMLAIGHQVKDAGTIFTGKEAVDVGLIHYVGGLKEALDQLRQKIASIEQEIDKK